MSAHRWFRIGVFHLVPEELLHTLPPHVEHMRDPAATAVECQQACFSLPGPWALQNDRQVTIDLLGLSLQLPALDVEPILQRLPHLQPMGGTRPQAYALGGDVRVLYLTETYREHLKSALEELEPRIRVEAKKDEQAVRSTMAKVPVWERPRRRVLH